MGKIEADAGGGTSRRRRSKPKKPSNPRLVGEGELCPLEDEVVVFRDYFVAGLVITCH